MRRLIVFAILACLSLGGCAKYQTPGGPAKISQMADLDIAYLLKIEPVATFPVNLALVRVQAPGYSIGNYRAYGSGAFSVALNSDVETEEQYNRVTAWPQVTGVARLSRLLLGMELKNNKDIRLAAAQLHTDMVLIYTLDTDFHIQGVVEPIGVLTLGFLPNKLAQVSTVASAILIDTQTGYVYGAADAKADTQQVANAWTSSEAVDQSRKRTETEALNKMIGECAKMWKGVVAAHGQRRKPAAN